jgi:hypothetical protein
MANHSEMSSIGNGAIRATLGSAAERCHRRPTLRDFTHGVVGHVVPCANAAYAFFCAFAIRAAKIWRTHWRMMWGFQLSAGRSGRI